MPSMDDLWTQSMWSLWTICMDSMKIIKIMVICGLSVDSPWTGIWVCSLPKKIPWNHGTSMESANPRGLHKDYLGE